MQKNQLTPLEIEAKKKRISDLNPDHEAVMYEQIQLHEQFIKSIAGNTAIPRSIRNKAKLILT